LKRSGGVVINNSDPDASRQMLLMFKKRKLELFYLPGSGASAFELRRSGLCGYLFFYGIRGRDACG
jgi:hypothetical protein